MNWHYFELIGPIETHKYRTNADASHVEYWSENGVPGISRKGWNRSKSATLQMRARKSLKEQNKC